MKDDFEKEMDRKFNECWEQVIQWKKDTVAYWLKQNNKEMVKFHRDVLKTMEEKYEKVKIKL